MFVLKMLLDIQMQNDYLFKLDYYLINILIYLQVYYNLGKVSYYLGHLELEKQCLLKQ